jgi:hypothetical protein
MPQHGRKVYVYSENTGSCKSRVSSIMEQPVLSDKNQFPTQAVISSHLGKAQDLWEGLFGYIHDSCPDFTEQWRYYNDGKSWLLKVSKKTKTVFWLSLIEGSFRTTFYFTDKARRAILRSSLSDDLKKQYRSLRGLKKIRGITILYRRKRDVEDAKRLIQIKTSIP